MIPQHEIHCWCICNNNMGYNYYKADFNKMRDMLDEIDWGIHLKELNVFKTRDGITKTLSLCSKDQTST